MQHVVTPITHEGAIDLFNRLAYLVQENPGVLGHERLDFFKSTTLQISEIFDILNLRAEFLRTYQVEGKQAACEMFDAIENPIMRLSCYDLFVQLGLKVPVATPEVQTPAPATTL